MSLKNLLALQKQQRDSQTAAKPPVVAPAPVEIVEATPVKASPFNIAGKRKLPGLNMGALPKPAEVPAAPAPKPAPLDDSFSLDDLAGMDAGSVAPIRETAPVVDSEYADEIEATAPERALDPELTAEQLAFVESLDGIYSILHDSEMFSQSVRMIMIELQENREYEKLLADSDIHVMIRGMRRSMGLARVRKQEKSSKTRAKTAARKKSGLDDHAMALLNSLMGDDDDD